MKVNIQSVLKANSSVQKRVKVEANELLMISFRKTYLIFQNGDLFTCDFGVCL